MKKTLLLMFMTLLVIVPGCQIPGTPSEQNNEQYRLDLIKEIKAFEARLGFNETENFKTYSDNVVAYDYTFFTPKTTLPYSLDDPGLQSLQGKPESIGIDPEAYDVYFYSIEALAGIQSPVTRSLLDTALPRFIYVIIHEDWHEQIDSLLGIEEPTGEVISYQAAMLFAEEKFGANSAVYQTLQKEFHNKLEESKVYRQYYDELARLYSQFQSENISESEALSRKAELLDAMSDEIKEIWGARRKQLNNASIAFQMTYFRHLTLVHQVYLTNSDLVKTVALFKSMPAQGAKFDSVEELKTIEKEITDYLQDVSRK